MHFIELFDRANSVVLINVKAVAAIAYDDSEDSATVVLTSGHKIFCRDSYEEVLAIFRHIALSEVGRWSRL